VDVLRGDAILSLSHKFFFGCLFALGPMIMFGALIPALMRTEKEVAGECGHLLWVSSLANATGYLVYVLVGHPLMSNSVLLALIAGLMLLASLISSKLRWSKYQGSIAVVSIILAAVMIYNWQDRDFYLAHWVGKLKPEDRVTTFKSDAESATLVYAKRSSKDKVDKTNEGKIDEDVREWEDIWISYNGHPSIYIQAGGIANFAERITGIIPALSAPRLDKALVIGLGTGITAGTASCLFEKTDVVEINKAFYSMLPYLKEANFDIEHNPSAELYLADGRAFLVGKENAYDAIISTVSAPTYFSASKIYTIEFYDRVAKSLKPDGVFNMWLSLGDMSELGGKTILSALHKNFRYCELRLLRGGYYTLTCSNQPIKPRRKFSDMVPSGHKLIEQLNLGLAGFDYDEFFEDVRLSENIFDHFTPQVPKENTDDHPVLEFMVVRSWQMKKMGSDLFMTKQALFNIDPVKLDEIADPARLARRASTFYWLGSTKGGYLSNFNTFLVKDANVASEFFLQCAKYNVAQKRYPKAAKLIKVALKVNPNLAEAQDILAEILQQQGRAKE